MSAMQKFPPTVIIVGDVDPLIDDATKLFDQLQSAGVRVRLKIYRSLPHGFLNLPSQLPHAYKAIDDCNSFLQWMIDQADAKSSSDH